MRLEAGRWVRVRVEQLLERQARGWVGRANGREPFGSCAGIQLHQRIERGPQLRPLCWIGGPDHSREPEEVRIPAGTDSKAVARPPPQKLGRPAEPICLAIPLHRQTAFSLGGDTC